MSFNLYQYNSFMGIAPTYGDKHCATLMGPFSGFSIISTLQIAITKFSFWLLLYSRLRLP